MRSIFSSSPFAMVALALGVACSAVGPQNGAPIEAGSVPGEAVRAEAIVPAPAAIEPSVSIEPPTRSVATVSEPAAVDARPARPSPIQALEQMLTAQALLVSLLLTPLSKDASQDTVARVDVPRGATGARLR
jgi:hypothetical protein